MKVSNSAAKTASTNKTLSKIDQSTSKTSKGSPMNKKARGKLNASLQYQTAAKAELN